MPVPLSPRTSVVESIGTPCSTAAKTDSKAGLLPMVCSNLRSAKPRPFDRPLLTDSTDDRISVTTGCDCKPSEQE